MVASALLALLVSPLAIAGESGGDEPDATTAGNSRGEAVEIQVRNRSRGETGLVTSSDDYSLRLSNTKENGGGGAVYGCRAEDAPPAQDLACLYADNLRGGKAFLFRSRQGPTVGHFDIGNPANPPFTTNATGLVQNLNADRVDGKDASELVGATGPAGPAGPQGDPGVSGLERVAGISVNSSDNKSITATCPAGKRLVGASGEILFEEGFVVIDEIDPDLSLTAVTVRAAEVPPNSTANNWRVIAYAICANVAS